MNDIFDEDTKEINLNESFKTTEWRDQHEAKRAFFKDVTNSIIYPVGLGLVMFLMINYGTIAWCLHCGHSEHLHHFPTSKEIVSLVKDFSAAIISLALGYLIGEQKK